MKRRARGEVGRAEHDGRDPIVVGRVLGQEERLRVHELGWTSLREVSELLGPSLRLRRLLADENERGTSAPPPLRERHARWIDREARLPSVRFDLEDRRKLREDVVASASWSSPTDDLRRSLRNLELGALALLAVEREPELSAHVFALAVLEHERDEVGLPLKEGPTEAARVFDELDAEVVVELRFTLGQLPLSQRGSLARREDREGERHRADDRRDACRDTATRIALDASCTSLHEEEKEERSRDDDGVSRVKVGLVGCRCRRKLRR